MNLLEESKRWHDDATALIKDSKITELLKQYGEVTMTGSYVYDLMLNSDIDFFVSNKNPTKELADELAIKLIGTGYWNSLMYCDWPTNDPPGPYFCIKREFRSHRWKIDIMITTPDKIAELLPPREIYANLADDKKVAILELKDAIAKSLLPKDVEAVKVYDAVIKSNIHGVDNFKKYLNKNE
jgi:hypothetical protein